jgi:hypothetical protein
MLERTGAQPVNGFPIVGSRLHTEEQFLAVLKLAKNRVSKLISTPTTGTAHQSIQSLMQQRRSRPYAVTIRKSSLVKHVNKLPLDHATNRVP